MQGIKPRALLLWNQPSPTELHPAQNVPQAGLQLTTPPVSPFQWQPKKCALHTQPDMLFICVMCDIIVCPLHIWFLCSLRRVLFTPFVLVKQSCALRWGTELTENSLWVQIYELLWVPEMMDILVLSILVTLKWPNQQQGRDLGQAGSEGWRWESYISSLCSRNGPQGHCVQHSKLKRKEHFS